MNERIDVLEALRHSSDKVAAWTAQQAIAFMAAEMKTYRPDIEAKCREAIAAVAELIEADKALDAANSALATTAPQSEDAETMESMRAHRNHCVARRRAALARVGGSK